MKDKLISFETAKLALEVGSNVGLSIFNYEVHHLDNKKVKIIELDLIIDLEDFEENLRLPTQSLLQKWLREKHNIVVLVEHCMLEDNSFGYFCRIYPEIKNTAKQFKIFEYSKSYEQALEKGLYESLKLIKNARKINRI